LCIRLLKTAICKDSPSNPTCISPLKRHSNMICIQGMRLCRADFLTGYRSAAVTHILMHTLVHLNECHSFNRDMHCGNHAHGQWNCCTPRPLGRKYCLMWNKSQCSQFFAFSLTLISECCAILRFKTPPTQQRLAYLLAIHELVPLLVVFRDQDLIIPGWL
jgi:hypothetical protein